MIVFHYRTYSCSVSPTIHGSCIYRFTDLTSKILDDSVGNVLAGQAWEPKFKFLGAIFKKPGACDPRSGKVETRDIVGFSGHPD